jgi:hypothetical protein
MKGYLHMMKMAVLIIGLFVSITTVFTACYPSSSESTGLQISPALSITETTSTEITSISQVTDPSSSDVEVEFDTNPVVLSSNDFWHYKMTLHEKTGTGIKTLSLSVQYYFGTEKVGLPQKNNNDFQLEQWLSKLYLPPTSRDSYSGSIPFEKTTSAIFSFSAFNDNGNEVTFSGTLYFQKPNFSKVVMQFGSDTLTLVGGTNDYSVEIILAEIHGVGMSIEHVSAQQFVNGQLVGDIEIIDSTKWFQSLNGNYLGPYETAKIKFPVFLGAPGKTFKFGHLHFVITGTDENGNKTLSTGVLNCVKQ